MKDKEKYIDKSWRAKMVENGIYKDSETISEDMIEEMAKDIPYLTLDRTVFVGATETKNVSWMLSEEDNKLIAEELIKKGWIKSNKDSIVQPTIQSYSTHDTDLVVLSREEYQKDFSSQFNKGYKHGSKEIVEKVLNKVRTMLWSCNTVREHDEYTITPNIGYLMKDVDDGLDEIEKEFSVEIKEN